MRNIPPAPPFSRRQLNHGADIMRIVPALAFGLVLASSVTAFAYTQEEANACTPDAMRLCSAAIPDAQRVGNCLYQRRAQLSAPCAAVFARYIGHGQERRKLASDRN
jgi:hypothetical protein